jgi:TonB-dependent receptor
VIPARTRDRDELEVGFPFLEFPTAMNLDLLYEKYWKGRNMFSSGLFYKKIDDFVFRYQGFAYENDPALGFNQQLWELTIPVSGQEAFVTGFETQVFSFFDFLPGKLKNLGGIVNYTYTYSEGRIPMRSDQSEQDNIVVLPESAADLESIFDENETETISMPGQAPHTLNLSLFYDSPKWYFKVSANYSDIFLETIGATPDLDQFYAAQWRVDLNGYYQINKHIQIFGDLRNVTNEPLRFYLGPQENERILLTEYYSFWARIGARLNF